MGNPIAHSLSPIIHHAFAKQCDIDLYYQAILVAADGLSAALSAFQKQGGKGLNITLPFKQEACQQVARRTDKAARLGVVNTICFDEHGKSHGDTTDGVGLLHDLRAHQIEISGKKVLVLGAGGAVRSVLSDLLAEKPAELMVANRTLARAKGLSKVFSGYSCLHVTGYADLQGRAYDIVINGSTASLQGVPPDLPDDILQEGGVCYDMVYASADTPFVAWGKAHGARLSIDGLGMLVRQAAESFYLWHGVKPETRAVIDMLRGTNF